MTGCLSKTLFLLYCLQGELKIADFGLARYMQKAGQQSDGRVDSKMTNRVITVWYRWAEAGCLEVLARVR